MNVNAIFDAVGKASHYVHLLDAVSNKETQIRNVLSKRCGNCFHWMKSSCIPEKKHKQFKSCNSFGCKDFALCPFHKELSEKFGKELDELKIKLATHNQPTAPDAQQKRG